VSVKQLAALARRHVLAVCLILLAATGIAIYFGHAPSSYDETAIVTVEPESFMSLPPHDPDLVFLANSSLITTCQLLTMRLSGPRGEAQLRGAGVTGEVSISVVNSYNADHPTYNYPDLLVSVTDGSPGTTHRQSFEVRQVIAANLADLQVGDHITNDDLIVAYILSDSGPISQKGSLIRTYAALVVLALVAMFLACRFLDCRARAATGVAQPSMSL
jgi:hypothetical protein